jgi:hypothetical protein
VKTAIVKGMVKYGPDVVASPPSIVGAEPWVTNGVVKTVGIAIEEGAASAVAAYTLAVPTTIDVGARLGCAVFY